jgi:hypothetical protein
MLAWKSNLTKVDTSSKVAFTQVRKQLIFVTATGDLKRRTFFIEIALLMAH